MTSERSFAGGVFNGGTTALIDEVKYESASANWTATKYANQSSPPAVGAFLPLAAGIPPAIY